MGAPHNGGRQEPGNARNVPQDLDAEMALIGAMLMSRDCYEEVLSIVTNADAFYSPAHRIIFNTCRRLYEKDGCPIDLITVSDALRARGEFDAVGGHPYTVMLAESFGDWTRARYYAQVVQEKFARRNAMKIAHDLWNDSLDLSTEVSVIPATYQKRLEGIGVTHAATEDIRKTIDAVRASYAAKAVDYISTGFQKFDGDIGGLEHPAYVILTGNPNAGKTALCVNWAVTAAKCGIDSLFLSLEMHRTSVAKRVMAAANQTPATIIQTKFSPEHQDAAAQTAKLFVGPGQVSINIDRRARNIREMRGLIAKHASQGGRIVFVDHIQRMHTGERFESTQVEVAARSNALLEMAADFNVTIVAVAHLDKASRKLSGPPTMSDLRDSGALEQDADQIFALWAKPQPKDEPWWQVALLTLKNRNNPLADTMLDFHRPTQRMIEQRVT